MRTNAVLGRIAHAEKRLEADDLEPLYRRYAPIVYRRCRALLGDDADARDALQDVFLRLFDALSGFRGEAQIVTWIYRIATNVCLNRIRRGKIERRVLSGLASDQAADPRPSLETRVLLHQLLAQLPEDRVQLLIYVHHDGLSQHEIGRILGVSTRTIRKRLTQIEHLAAELAPRLENWRSEDD